MWQRLWETRPRPLCDPAQAFLCAGPERRARRRPLRLWARKTGAAHASAGASRLGPRGVGVTVTVKQGKDGNCTHNCPDGPRGHGSLLDGDHQGQALCRPRFRICDSELHVTASACGRRTFRKSEQGVPASLQRRALASLLVRETEPCLTRALRPVSLLLPVTVTS